jgi:hypothetical protein
MVWRSYRFLCPGCGKTYLKSLSPLFLGTGKRRCPNCAIVFADGSKEWPELQPMQKFEYICPTMVLGYFGGLVVVIGVAFFAAADSRELELMLGVLTLCMILPWIPYFLSRRDSIRSSKERFVRRQTFGSSEDLILPA